MTTDPSWRRPRKERPEPHVGRLRARMAKGATLEEAAEGLGIPLWLAKAVFVRSGMPVPQPIRRGRGGRQERLDEARLAAQRQTILIALRVFSIELGAQMGARGAVPVTMAYWDARRDPSQHPGAATVAIRFGTWSEACRAAGVPLRKPL